VTSRLRHTPIQDDRCLRAWPTQIGEISAIVGDESTVASFNERMSRAVRGGDKYPDITRK